MLKIKQELQETLAAALRELAPDAAVRAVFESPKVAAHGDFASTAAMQLAKPLKLNPRQVAERLRALLLAQPSYQTWVADIDIAGPGFLNIRLQPAAKQQIVREVLQAGDVLATRARAANACWSSLCRPTRPARCMWATAARPRSATRSATCMPARAGRSTASSITTTPACRSPHWPTAPSCAPVASGRGMPPGPKRPTTATTSKTSQPISWPARRSVPMTGPPPPAATSTIWTASASLRSPTCATSRTWTCRPLR
jgi:hypothetical protein